MISYVFCFVFVFRKNATEAVHILLVKKNAMKFAPLINVLNIVMKFCRVAIHVLAHVVKYAQNVSSAMVYQTIQGTVTDYTRI